jgi:hypothetical protein
MIHPTGWDSASCVVKLMRRVDATSNCRARKFGGHKPDAHPSVSVIFCSSPRRFGMDQPVSGGGIGLPCAGFGP